MAFSGLSHASVEQRHESDLLRLTLNPPLAPSETRSIELRYSASWSAGLVLLEVLRHHDLIGGIVVSRIFGGVKLGAGGVARAFRQVAAETVELLGSN